MGEFCQGNLVLGFIFYIEKYINDVMKRNLVKHYMVSLFNKFVRFFLEQVPHFKKSQ